MTDAPAALPISSRSASPMPGITAGHRWLVHLIFVASGAVSLIYQVLWMRQLGTLFGNTAQATATTLTAFFLGLALGGWSAGNLAPRLRNPLRAYGWAELGVAGGALLYFGLVRIYAALYPPLFHAFGHQPSLFLALKFVLGVVVLLPAASLIGATLPLVGQHLLRRPDALGSGATVLYAVNTLGAALGAYLAAFVLPLSLGFRGAYFLAVGLNVALAAIVLTAARGADESAAAPVVSVAPEPRPFAFPTWTRIRALAFATGLVTLALEVLWTTMFAQVLHNSVYTFALILISFLVALALGSLLAHALIRGRRNPVTTIGALLGTGSLLVWISPWLFYGLTDGLSYVAVHRGWVGYQLVVFSLAAAVIVPPTVLLGTVFPYLMKLSEVRALGAGRTLGRLVAINTLGAIVGSLLAGFVLLQVFGLWSAIRVLALLGLAAIPMAVARRSDPNSVLFWEAALVLLLPATVSLRKQIPELHLDRDNDERVVQVWHGSAGVVSVVETPYDRTIKINNHYTLGGSGSLENERRQGLLPLLLHPDPEEVFYLGMGTGITASAAMTPHVRRATVCELVPEVITAARTQFGPYTAGMFTDPRTRILAEDGRTFLSVTDERYDAIISDLFVPWEARSGSLYAVEHFRSARGHLKPGGVFAQWIPLYQMSRREFAIVARTMLAVFPQVTAWRGDLLSDTPTLVLIGQVEQTPLDPDVVSRRIDETPDPALIVDSGMGAGRLLWAYCGNLSAARSLIGPGPINSDDHPLIEYLAPMTHRSVSAGHSHFLIRDELTALHRDLLAACPPESDPYLARVPAPQREFVRAGFYIHAKSVDMVEGRVAEADSMDHALTRVLREAFKRDTLSGR